MSTKVPYSAAVHSFTGTDSAVTNITAANIEARFRMRFMQAAQSFDHRNRTHSLPLQKGFKIWRGFLAFVEVYKNLAIVLLELVYRYRQIVHLRFVDLQKLSYFELGHQTKKIPTLWVQPLVELVPELPVG